MTLKVYMIVTNDIYELPVECGLVGAKAVADYLGLSVSVVRKCISSGKWSHLSDKKAVVDLDGTEQEIERRRLDYAKRNFMKDRSEYFRQRYRKDKVND